MRMMDILFDRFIDLLKGLIRQPSVVGAEHSFFRVLQRELEERGARVTWYECDHPTPGYGSCPRFLKSRMLSSIENL